MSVAEYPLELEVAGVPPGQQLAAARASRGMTVSEIAQQLKLSSWQVEALESGDHRRLPSAVFVRGFMRNYARLVKLDPATLLATGEAQHLAPLGRSASSSPEIPYPTARRGHRLKYAVIALVLLMPLIVYEFYPEYMQAEDGKTDALAMAAPQVVVEASTTLSASPVGDGLLTTSAAASEKPFQPAPMSATPTLQNTTVAVENSRVTAGAQVVRLRFTRSSWVEIRDRDGNRIFSQMNSPGTEQVVSGAPPLHVIVGNANGVQLIHNEQPVNLGPYTKVDVARLTLE